MRKIPAWQLTKVRNEKEVIEGSFRVIGSLSSQEFGVGALKIESRKGRVVLRGDIVRDDSGSYAVFTEQGSSASQMIAAKVMDIISRLPGCAGQATDAVFGFFPGQNGRCSKIIENSQIGMSRHLDTSTETRMAQVMSSMADPVVLLERNMSLTEKKGTSHICVCG